MTSSSLAPVIDNLIDARDFLDDLERNGWSIGDNFNAISIVSDTCENYAPLRRNLDRIAEFAEDARLIGEIGPARIRLRIHQGGIFVDQLPVQSPTDLFDDASDRRVAEELWSGEEASKALLLPFLWHAEAEIDLSPLVRSFSDVRVTRHLVTLQSEFDETPYWMLRDLIPGQGRRLYLALDGPIGRLDLGAVSFAGPKSQIANVAHLDIATSITPDAPDLSNLLPPAALLPTPNPVSIVDTTGWTEIHRSLENSAAASALCILASEARLIDEGPRLIFRGLRSISLRLESIPPEAVQPVLDLFHWAIVEPNADRLLAVQQVASLQDDLLLSIGEIRASAEIVYAGLRSDAVTEAVRGFREANAYALDVARQTAKSVQDMVKAQTERSLASLIAVGAILIGRSQTALDRDVSVNLLLSVAGFLIFLALTSIFLEGPLNSISTKNLSGDLRAGSPLLTEQQVKRFAENETITLAKKRRRHVRVVIPSVYVVAALLIIFAVIPKVP